MAFDIQALPFAEIVASLSLATDLANDQPLESAMRTCLVAVKLAEAAGASREQLADVYYASLFRFIGCTAYSHEAALAFDGDDNALHSTFAGLEPRRLGDMLPVLTARSKGRGIVGGARALTTFAVDAPGVVRGLATSSCEVAVRLTRRIGMGAGVTTALEQTYERWDGRGVPGSRSGDEIAWIARIIQVARMIELHVRGSGIEEARDILRRRAGGQLDPHLVRIFLDESPMFAKLLAQTSAWEDVLALAPDTGFLTTVTVEETARAFAEFVDLKSVYTLGHSTAVSKLAEDAGAVLGMSDEERHTLKYAGLLHDLGHVAVPTGIWEKHGALNEVERERVRLHPYYTERVLSRSPLLAPIAAVAAAHHERLDASGYPLRAPGAVIPRASRVLAAADCYEALLAERPHRAALDAAAASERLQAEAAEGKLDRDAVEAVLEAAGHAQSRSRKGWPSGLTDREVEVLRWVAIGKSNKEIGSLLSISARTVQNHVRHIYDKIGVHSRASAALYAAEFDLLRS